MPCYRKTIKAGDVYECEEYFSLKSLMMEIKKTSDCLLSSEAQKKNNLKNARKKLTRLINANFGRYDLFIGLDYAKLTTYEEAVRHLENFFKRLKRRRKKMGLPDLKYISVIEGRGKRVHHHMIVNVIDLTMQEWVKLWGHGRVSVTSLDTTGDYEGLAKYITKENIQVNAKRWTSSRNLTKPQIEVKEIKSTNRKRRLRVPKGYHEVEYACYYNEFTASWTQYIKAIKIGGMDYGEKMKERLDE